MNFQSEAIYKHSKCTDTAIKVIRSEHIPGKQMYKVRLWWLNVVNPKNVFLIFPYPVTEMISEKEFANWQPFKTE